MALKMVMKENCTGEKENMKMSEEHEPRLLSGERGRMCIRFNYKAACMTKCAVNQQVCE